jgi:hypothetical protein
MLRPYDGNGWGSEFWGEAEFLDDDQTDESEWEDAFAVGRGEGAYCGDSGGWDWEGSDAGGGEGDSGGDGCGEEAAGVCGV